MKKIQIDDYKVNNPPYEEINRLWSKAERLKIPDYKTMIKSELIKAITKAREK